MNITPLKDFFCFFYLGCISREGVIIECPLNDLFHELMIDVLTSRTDVSEVVEKVDNVVTVVSPFEMIIKMLAVIE